MLNLPIAMLKVFLLLTLLFQNPSVTLTSPQSGDTLRGQVEIQGAMDVAGFQSAELAFSFLASNPADSWFTIQTFPQPKVDSLLAIWDTTSITDGDYTLRLRIYLQDGTTQDAVITDLKIRNDIILSTETPTEVFQISTPIISATESIVQGTPTLSVVQPTALPPNPVSIETDSIYKTFFQGVIIAILIFAFASLILYLRKNN